MGALGGLAQRELTPFEEERRKYGHSLDSVNRAISSFEKRCLDRQTGVAYQALLQIRDELQAVKKKRVCCASPRDLPQPASPQLARFVESVPYRPYCTDSFKFGLSKKDKASALCKSHIQYNPPPLVVWLIFDIDHEDAALKWKTAGLLPPAWVAENPQNGHAHIAYGLSSPVSRTLVSRLKPLRYLAAIEAGLREKLCGDPGYASLITKNPLSPAWLLWTPGPDEGVYDLATLAKAVGPLPSMRARIEIRAVAGVGRNCQLFDDLRGWAYHAVRDFWRPGGGDAFQAACLANAQSFNCEFKNALCHSEIKAIARSVALWVWREFTPAKFREIQIYRALASAQSRNAKSQPVRAKALELAESGMARQEIALKLHVCKRTVQRWLNPDC
jgi:hypothetical protein